MIAKITLEDQGQDMLELFVDDNGLVIDAQPFQADVWKGCYVPIGSDMVEVGKRCPIHNPPHINFGLLKYNIEKIEEIL